MNTHGDRDAAAKLAGEHWDGKYASRSEPAYRVRDWLESPYVLQRYVNPAISGSGDIGWFEYLLTKYVRGKNIRRALDLGCGIGQLEQATLPFGLIERMEAYDVSPVAIEQARAHSVAHGYADKAAFHCMNVESASYPDGAFDLVLVGMALHHVLNLERVLENVKRWKSPGAMFCAFEYVGPNRFQWSPTHVEHLNRVLRDLPAKYRAHGVDGHLVEKVEAPPIIEMIKGDPSESIRSADIMGLLDAYFEIVERRDFGGTLLQPLLGDLIHNFDTENSEDCAQLDALFAEERRLIASGELPHHFTLVACR